MYHLIIAAFPEAAAVVMVGQETENVDAAEVYRDYAFQSDLVECVRRALATFDSKIEDITVYGPRIYVTPIAANLREVFPTYNVVVEGAGD